MDLINHNLMYEFHARDLAQIEGLKQISDHTAKEIKSIAGWDADVEVTIEPESKTKGLFAVSIRIYVLGEHIFIKKEGRNAMSVLRKVRKSALRKLHGLCQKRVNVRRKHFINAAYAA